MQTRLRNCSYSTCEHKNAADPPPPVYTSDEGGIGFSFSATRQLSVGSRPCPVCLSVCRSASHSRDRDLELLPVERTHVRTPRTFSPSRRFIYYSSPMFRYAFLLSARAQGKEEEEANHHRTERPSKMSMDRV